MNSPASQPTMLLLNQACTGDAAAMDALLRHVGDRLSNLAGRMLGGFPRVRRWAETNDVLQNALLRLLNALRDVKPTSPRDFFALAAVQIRRELIDLARHFQGPNGIGANHPPTPLGANGPPDPPDARHKPESMAHWGELHQRIQQLPEEEREVVGLLFYQGLPQAEAAEILGLSLRTLQRRWHSALAALHRFWHGG